MCVGWLQVPQKVRNLTDIAFSTPRNMVSYGEDEILVKLKMLT
jgi:hypothetical protein